MSFRASYRLILLCTTVCGCAHVTTAPESARKPAKIVSAGGLNDEESAECEDSECHYFIAPCSMKEHSPLYRAPGSVEKNVYVSLKEEAYLDELENLSQRGYCQMAPRALPADLYNKDTCIYVFKKSESCN